MQRPAFISPAISATLSAAPRALANLASLLQQERQRARADTSPLPSRASTRPSPQADSVLPAFGLQARWGTARRREGGDLAVQPQRGARSSSLPAADSSARPRFPAKGGSAAMPEQRLATHPMAGPHGVSLAAVPERQAPSRRPARALVSPGRPAGAFAEAQRATHTDSSAQWADSWSAGFHGLGR
jgi:hypothetical protein